MERVIEKEFDLDGIVPWGRTFDEYCAFFALDERDLSNRSPVLDVAAGPSSFVAEANARKIRATAIDPIYGASGPDIRRRFEQVFPAMVSGLGRASYRFQWGYYDSPDAVLAHRRTALERFMADYDCGRQEGRYLVGGLPGLPIETDACGIALCSHLLFLYSEELDEAFHCRHRRTSTHRAGGADFSACGDGWPAIALCGESTRLSLKCRLRPGSHSCTLRVSERRERDAPCMEAAMTVLVIGMLRFPSENLEAVRPHLQVLVETTRECDGCIEYDVAEDIFEPGLVRFSEQWPDAESLQAHLRAAHIAPWRRVCEDNKLIERVFTAFDTMNPRPI